MQPQNEGELLSLLKENTALAQANNRLLKKMHRNAIIEMWLRILWYAILIGLPFALYFYILEPYVKTFGSSFEQIRTGAFPGIEMFQELFKQRPQ